jgi:DNA-binding winged helix-turn-helix (wHTH) protein
MSAELISVGAVRFGDFELDLRTRELRKCGLRLSLETKQFQLLELLVENSGRLVTRKELREKLWPDSFVEFDRGIYTAMNRLRKALGDTSDCPRYIETRSRLGYRFVAPVTPADVVARPFPWALPSNTEGQSNPGPISSTCKRSSPTPPLVTATDSGFDGAALRFQLPRGNGELAELSLRLTTTQEGALNMQIEFSGVRSEQVPRISTQRGPRLEYNARRHV